MKTDRHPAIAHSHQYSRSNGDRIASGDRFCLRVGAIALCGLGERVGTLL
ncbi:hypothetical protein HC928_22090 [bacterium]|nr:hypothetical protein [bacterium]